MRRAGYQNFCVVKQTCFQQKHKKLESITAPRSSWVNGTGNTVPRLWGICRGGGLSVQFSGRF